MNKLTATQLEKRIIWVALAFAAVLLALSALAINLFHVGLPTCLTDVKPFQKGELIAHSPTHYELHYVARMWKFEPEDVTIPAGSTVDIYLSAADVTHGLIMLGTNLNLMAVKILKYKFSRCARKAARLKNGRKKLVTYQPEHICHARRSDLASLV